MLVVIAPEKDIESELNILNQLFEAGLECFHLRKPEKDRNDYSAYIEAIDPEFHNRIVVHSFHELVNQYDLKGIHFNEQNRKACFGTPGDGVEGLKLEGKTVSSSFHEPEDIVKCEFEFDYHFLSPIFDSISKVGYEGRKFDVTHIDKFIVGMGGVSVDNLEEIKQLGFKGIGVLGGVWNAPSPVDGFRMIHHRFATVE